MPRRARAVDSVDGLLDELEIKLDSFRSHAPQLSVQENVARLVDIQHGVRCLSVSTLSRFGLNPRSAIDRLSQYLQLNVGKVVSGQQLETVSGISEYARRIRQLRVERGFRIATGASPDPFSGIDLKPDQYLLLSIIPDEDAGQRWQVANRIRKMSSSVRDRILMYLKENVKKVVTTEELAYVARDKREFGRRTRELRTEEGYAIATHFSGRPDLSMGEYVLLSVDRIAEPHDRHIPESVQREVYARDRNTCRNPDCRYQLTASDPRILELHHLKAHARRGSNTADNLLLLCNVCHDDVHAGRLDVLRCMFSEEE